jgi:hypothetical protein
MLLFHWIGAACPIDTPIRPNGRLSPIEIRPHVGAAFAARLADKLRLDI